MTAAAQDLVARAEQLRADVTDHKAAIRRHREQLGKAKAALVEIEARLRGTGIALVVHESPSEHGASQ